MLRKEYPTIQSAKQKLYIPYNSSQGKLHAQNGGINCETKTWFKSKESVG